MSGPAAGVSDPVRTLVAARALQARRQQRRPSTPAELARRIVPNYRITPAVSIISAALADAITEPSRRIIVTCPPREGKSTLVGVIGTLFTLARNPDARIILASYADSLASEHSHTARALVTEHADLLGFRLSGDKTAVGRWRVDGHAGGLLAAGILSGITGFGADLLILDDVTKNAQEADSAAHRRKVLHEFRSTLMTRLHPGASVVVVGTRWHEDDLVGTLLEEEPDRWVHVNIPAVSEVGVADALGRAPGVTMTSAIGRTVEQFDDIRRSVGERVWASLFQGVPSPLEGGLVKREWFDRWRLPVAPERPILTVIGVDPSDSGRGDACGIVAASMTREGVVTVVADRSAPMTAEQWSRAAIELALDVGASEIAVEGFAARETYLAVVRDALTRYKVGRPIRVSSWPPRGSGRGGGDALARSSALLQGFEVGSVRLAGHHPELEAAALLWQSGQHQPDALAALVVAHDVVTHAVGRRMSIASPLRSASRVDGRVSSMSEFLNRRLG